MNNLPNAKQEAEALRKISATISSEVKLDKVAKTILDELRKIVEYRTASIQLIQGDTRSLAAGCGFEGQPVDEWLVRPISKDPLVKHIVDTQETIVLPSVSAEPKWETSHAKEVNAWVGAPLNFKGTMIGLLTLDHDREGYYTDSVKEILEPFCSLAAIALQNARSHDLEIVTKVVDVIGDKFNSEELLDTLANQIARQLDCTHCSIFLARKESNETWLILETAHGPFKDEVKHQRLKSDFGVAGWVYSNGQSTVIPDARYDDRFEIGTVKPEEPRSMLVAPIKVGTRTIGIISADQDRFGWFSENNRRLVDAMAQQVGIAIQRVTALEVFQGISRQILTEPDICKLLERIVTDAIRLTYTSSGVIYIIGEDGNTITANYSPSGFNHPPPRLSNKQGITYQVIKTGKVKVFQNIRDDEQVNPVLNEDFQSMIAVPLKLGQRVMGVLYLNDEELHTFTETEITLLTTLADQAAIALEQQQRLSKLEYLRSLGQQLSFGVRGGLNKLLTQVAEGACDLTGANCAVIYPYDPVRAQFYKLEGIGAYGLQQPEKDLKNISRHAGLASRVHQAGLIMVQDVEKSDIKIAPQHNESAPPEDIDTLNALINKANFIKREDIQAFVGVSLVADYEDRAKNSPAQEVGILYINFRSPHMFSNEELYIIQIFAYQVANAIYNARLFDEAERRANDLGIVNEVVKAISTESGQQELCRKIAAEVIDKLNSDHCTLFIWSHQKNKLVPEMAVDTEIKQDFSPGEGVAGWVYQHGQSVLIDDTSQDERKFLSEADQEIERSMVVVPVKVGDKMIGVISVDKDQPGWFDHNHQQLLETLMSQAGYAIQQARELEIFEEVADLTTSQQNVEAVLKRIIQRSVELLNVNSGVIHLIHKDGHRLEESVPYPEDFPHPESRFEKQAGLTYEIYQTCETIIVDKADQDPHVNRAEGEGIKSIIGVPLQYQKKVIGVLFLNNNDPRQYSQAEQSLLLTLTDQAAIAIENARLFEELKQTNKELDQQLARTRALSELGDSLSVIELED